MPDPSMVLSAMLTPNELEAVAVIPMMGSASGSVVKLQTSPGNTVKSGAPLTSSTRQ